MSDNIANGVPNSPTGANAAGVYAGLIGLGDTERLDSSLYDEQVDFDFFETGGGSSSANNQATNAAPTTLNLGSAADVGLTVTVDPPTPNAMLSNNSLLLQVVATNQHGRDDGSPQPPRDKVAFSTQQLMAALQDTQPSDSNSTPDKDRQSVRVHLFDLTDSEDDGLDEQELAEINGHAQAGAGELHSWEAHDFYHHQHLQQQQQRERAQAKKKRHRAAHPPAVAGGLDCVGILDRKSTSDEDANAVESDDDDEEGYYLSDSERSDITDVTPMSSVACSPMPPYANNAQGSPYPSSGAPGDSDDSYDGYPINHEDENDDIDNCDGDDDELGRITPSEDDDDIDEILRILPNSATGQNFEIPIEGNVDPFMKMYRDGPNSPAIGAVGEETEADFHRQYTMNSVSAGLDRHYYSIPTGPIDTDSQANSANGEKDNGVNGKGTNTGNTNGNNLLTVNYGNASKNFVDAQRRRMLAAAHSHHTARHHHPTANGLGPRLNKVHHPATNGHGHHHHHGHHGPGSYFYGHGHGGHHFNHHHGHGHHHNNYHQQYHNLTMALQRKRQSQQKQIDHDNSILKRKIETVKPSLDIMKAFGPTINVTTSSSTSSSASTPAPYNINKKNLKAGAVVSTGGSSTSSSVCGRSTSPSTTASGSGGSSTSVSSGKN